MDLSADLATAVATVSAAGSFITARCRDAGDEPVLSCPGWTVRDLTTHIGEVHTWAAANLSGTHEGRAPWVEAPAGLDAAATAAWADDARGGLLVTFSEVDPDAPAWAFGLTLPRRFWWRRQALETAMHAWDAGGRAIGPEVAADGIDELLMSMAPRWLERKPPEWGRGRSVHVHRTDGEGEWLISLGPPATVERGHKKGDLAVRGAALDLWLWLLNRGGDVELIGDTELAVDWGVNFSF